MELQPLAEAEGDLGEVCGRLGMLGQALGEQALWHGLDHRVVDEIVIVLLGQGDDVVLGV